MDGVLEPSARLSVQTLLHIPAVNLLREPVHSERDEYDQSNDLAIAAASGPVVACRIVARMVGCVNSHKCDREPSAQCHCNQTSNERDHVHMTVFLRDVDRRLQHQDAEGDARNPADEADDVEDAKQQEDDTPGPVTARKHVKCCRKPEDDVEDAGDPYELFCELTRSPHVGVAEDGGHTEHECGRYEPRA